MRVGLVTSSDLPELHEDERPLVEALRRRGAEPIPLVWGEAALGADVDAYLIRTPWDWYLHADEFEVFLARLPVDRTWNAPSLMRTHLDKAYLARMLEAGVPMPPTCLVEGDTTEVAAAIASAGWRRAVVKPLRSAGAHRTRLVEGTDVPRLGRDRWLVQRYLPEVEAGELSFVFIDGRLSHVVRKRPRPGDFRVQAEHGGTYAPETAGAGLVAQAERALAALPSVPLYARVDGVVVEDTLLLMELEVVEPQLFFGLCPEAGERMSDALLRRIEAV